MDKKLLQALDNIGNGLEMLVDALNNKEEAQSSTGAALQGGDFGKQLESINAGIKSIKADTQEIIKNQQTIIALSKKKEDDKKTEEFEGASDPKKESAIKKGVATILLIAVAVLAIGMAFKLVGDVDFLSVVGLALAITLISIAFEKVANLKLSIKEAFITSAVMVIMAAAVTASSWILSTITPISLGQAVTGILIGVMFYFLLPAAASMIKAMESEDEVEFNGMKMKTKGLKLSTVLAAAFALPLIMIGVSLGITASSWILSGVKPLSIMQAITAIGIGFVFAIIAPVIGAIITGITTEQEGEGLGFGFKKKGVSIEAALVASFAIPIIMMAMSVAILGSSYILAEIKPVGIFQILTAIAISAVFTVLAFGLASIVSALDTVDPAKALVMAIILPILFVAISYAMMLSSEYFSQIKLIGFGQFLTALAISIIFVVLSFAVAVISRALKDLTVAGALVVSTISVILFVALSYAIMVSSEYLSKVTPVPFMTLLNIVLIAIALTVSVAVFGLGIWLLKKLGFTSPAGALQFLIGAGLFLVVAATIMISSLILGLGEYKTYPSLEWTLGVGVAFVAFSVALVALGALALTGLGAAAFFVGIPMALSLAGTIVAVSHILAQGNYNLPGFLDWAKGTALLYAAFTPILLILGAVGLANAVISFFGPNPWEMAKEMMLEIAQTIVAVSYVLAVGNYAEGPSEKWAKGVAIALGAFSSVYDMLSDSQSLFGGGPSPAEFTTAILTVTWGIVTSANMLANASASFENGPPYEWSRGVGKAIGAFAPVFDILAQSESFWGGPSPADFASAIMTVCQGIVDAAWFFSENTAPFEEGSYPSEKWGKGVGAAIGAFSQVFTIMAEQGSGWFGSDMDEIATQLASGVRYISGSIVDAGYIFANASDIDWESSYPSKDWAKGVGAAIGAFSEIFTIMVEQGSGWFGDDMDEVAAKLAKGVRYISSSIADAGRYMSRAGEEGWKAFPSKEWGTGVKNAIGSFLDIFDMIWKSGISTKLFSQLASRVNSAVSYMAATAKTLWTNRKFFGVKLDPKFVDNIKPNIEKFIDLAKYVDKELTEEVEVTDYGLFGASSRKVKVSKTDILRKPMIVASAMAGTAQVLWRNRKFFNYKINASWIGNVRRTISGFVKMSTDLADGSWSELNDIGWRWNSEYKDGESYLNSKRVDKVLWSMIHTARIVGSNAKYFNKKINPNFMKDVGQNMLDFNEIVKKLKEGESESSGFFGRIGESFERMIGSDPITQIAKRMITLAQGYDELATSLMKLGKAMQTLNIGNTKELPFLGKGSVLRSPEELPTPKITSPKPRKMPEVGESTKGVGLRPTPKNEGGNDLIKELKEIKKIMSSIAVYMKDSSETLDTLNSITSEYYDKNKPK